LRNPTSALIFQIIPAEKIQATPSKGRVAPDGVTEIELSFLVDASGTWSAILEVEVRGGKPLKLPMR
jgi:hypothetical protein